MPASFLDTNVLVYIASGDAARADRAEAAVAAGGAISVQVLNELANVARRKMQISWGETHALGQSVSRCDLSRFSPDDEFRSSKSKGQPTSEGDDTGRPAICTVNLHGLATRRRACSPVAAR